MRPNPTHTQGIVSAEDENCDSGAEKYLNRTNEVIELHQNGSNLAKAWTMSMNELYPTMNSQLTMNPRTSVQRKPPTKPSTVFFGLNWINGVLPQKKPQT